MLACVQVDPRVRRRDVTTRCNKQRQEDRRTLLRPTHYPAGNIRQRTCVQPVIDNLAERTGSNRIPQVKLQKTLPTQQATLVAQNPAHFLPIIDPDATMKVDP